MIIRAGAIVAALLTCLVQLDRAAMAQAATAPASEALGEQFQSRAAGIAFRPPANMKEFRGPVGSRELVRFFSEERHWALRVERVLLDPDKPVPLTTWKDKEGIDRAGMLEITVNQFTTENPGAQILRQDTTNIGDAPVGMMAARYNYGLDTSLLQKAIVHASDQQYFVFTMSSPAPRQGELESDPGVKSAVEAFSHVLDSMQLLDQMDVSVDRNERLLRTRVFYVNLTEGRLRSALQPEQWFRMLRNGKDIGYMYVVEEIARGIPRKGKPERQTGPEGVLVGARSRLVSQTGAQLDSESWLFCTFDRHSEAWSSVSYADDPKAGKSSGGELGISRWRERPIPVNPQGIGSAMPRGNPSLTEEYRMEVTRLGRNISSEPIARDLPPFYLPQAIGQLLPRLVPLREPRTLLFASWVTDAEQLMYRYVDVGTEQEVMLGGKRVRAIAVKDRVGLEGSVTTHYVSPEGKYLGSVNSDSKITILPADASGILQIWKNANLSRPGEVEGKE